MTCKISPIKLFAIVVVFFSITKESFPIEKEKVVLRSWREAFINAGKSEALPPNLIVRNLALLSLGCFEAINAKEQTFQSYFAKPYSPPLSFERISALRGFCLKLGKSLHPSRQSLFKRIAHQNSLHLDKLPHNPSFLFGNELAIRILQERMDDGSTTQVTYLPRTDPGKWRRTAPHFRPPEQPHWPKVRLFCLPTLREFVPPPPPEPDTKEYFQAVREVKLYGAKTSPLRTAEQTDIAQFWKDFSYSSTPPGHWNQIAQSLSVQRNLNILQEARLFALLNLCMADAGIVAWESKYHYHLWRPIQAIRLGDQFKSTQTLTDPLWDPLLETPPHPEYVSGHGCYSGAAAQTLRQFLGTDEIKFFVKSSSPGLKPRSFASLSQCAQEVCDSRLWGGIHYRFSNEKALQTGKFIAQYVHKNFLYPKSP